MKKLLFLCFATIIMLLGLAACSSNNDPIVNESAVGRLSGYVTDDSNRPIIGAIVSIEALSEKTETDSHGRYEFKSLKTGNYEVTFTKDGYSTVKKMVNIKGNDETNLDITLDITITVLETTITGTVKKSGGSPITGRQVWLKLKDKDDDTWESNKQQAVITRTSSDGSFKFDNLKPGVYFIRTVSPDGYVGKDNKCDPVETVDLTDGGNKNVDFVFYEGVRLDVYVYEDVIHAALDGCKVTLNPGGITRTTDYDGMCSFYPILPGKCTLSTSLEGHQPVEKDIEVYDYKECELILTTYKGYLYGYVTDVNGNDISGALVSYTFEGETKSKTTGEYGQFSFQCLKFGNYTLSVSKSGYVTRTANVNVDSSSPVRTDFVLLKPRIVSSSDALSYTFVNSTQNSSTGDVTIEFEVKNVSSITQSLGFGYTNRFAIDNEGNRYSATLHLGNPTGSDSASLAPGIMIKGYIIVKNVSQTAQYFSNIHFPVAQPYGTLDLFEVPIP